MSEIILHCPRCSKHDTPKLYVNVELGLFNCYRCGDFKGRIRQLYKYPEVIAKIEEQLTLAEYSKLKTFKPLEVRNVDVLAELNPVREVYYEDPQYQYLINRGWTDDLVNIYRPLVSTNASYKDRVILPVIVNDKIVYYTARSLDPDSKLKYRNPSKVSRKNVVFKSLIPESILYPKDAVVGEGFFDMFKVPNGIALLGKTISEDNESNLLEFLANRSNIYVCLDLGAEKEILDICAKLASWFPTKDIFRIDTAKYEDKDLGNLSTELTSIELLAWIKKNSVPYKSASLSDSIREKVMRLSR